MPWKFYHRDSPYFGSARRTNPVSSRRALNRAATTAQERQATVAGQGEFLPIPYGRVRAGGKICAVAVKDDHLCVLAAFTVGEIDSFEAILVNGADINDPEKGLVAAYGGEVNLYRGTQDQTVDPILQWAIEGYGDTLPGVAYCVLKIPSSAEYSSFPRVEAVIKGLRVYDPRTGQVAYSENPALVLADFISHDGDDYGLGWPIDWSSVATVADACDELVADVEPRRRIGLLLDRPLESEEWLEPLRTYAGCFISFDGGVCKLIPDRPSDTVVISFTPDNIRRLVSLRKESIVNKPTVIEVVYTKTDTEPWRDYSVFVMKPGVEEGTEPWRLSTVRLPGIQRASQAKREGVERLNKLITDLQIELEVFDEGLQLEPGDVFSVTHPVGLENKLFRCLEPPELIEPGRWRVKGYEYDPAVYSDEVISEPTLADTTLPDPRQVPTVSGLTVDEIFGQKSDGTYFSKVHATWDHVAQTWPYFRAYEVQLWQGSTLISQAQTVEPEFTSPPVEERKLYTVKVRVLGSLAPGEFASADYEVVGKYAPPSDVPSVFGFEVGGEVRLRWEPAPDIDIWRYEVRYWAEGESWEDGTVLDRVDGLRLLTKDVPAGTWIFGVKAIDCVGNYSANPATVTIEVTLDLEAFKALDATFSVEDLANASNITAETVFVTDANNVVTKVFTRAVAALGTAAEVFTDALTNYPDPAYSYRLSGTCSCDLGPLPDPPLDPAATGTWRGQKDGFRMLRGAPTLVFSVLLDGSAVASTAGTQYSLNATGDQCKWHAEASGTDVFALELPDFYSRCDAIPRKESGQGTSNASGPTTITLERTYNAARRIVITPKGTAALTAVVDNVQPEAGRFDVYIFNSAGDQVSAEFFWEWEGV